ncbi:hypothetical protein Q8F55_006438 [Vanrija albida]|uniref:RanBD1 domain-containing protein n=1 Tax=Vanrija albida TaxID=181172 RepID=A0ABR3PX31_9TREE
MSSPDGRPTTAPLPTDEASSNGQPSTARESISLKRGREGSVDPQASETPTSSHIAAKKNRLETASADADIVETDEDASAAAPLKPEAGKEGHTVGEVRRKVEELNWEEGAAPRDGAKAEVDVDASEDSKDNDNSKADSKAASDAADSADWVKVSKPDEDGDSAAGTSESESPSLKRKAGDEADVSSVASDEKKRKSTSPAPRTEKDSAAASATASAPTPSSPPKKPQATFGAFSSKSSPFASLSSSSSPFGSVAASSSPFGSVAASSSPFGSAAAKPSPFASAAGSSSPFGSVKPKSALDSAPAAKPAGTSGFGNYSNAFTQFAKKSTDAADADKPEASTSTTTFGDILQEKHEEEKEEKVVYDKQDVVTGEEDEETVFQTRVKLFSMDQEGAWRERGLGALKLNKRRADGGGARLVMRADGVLRVILNSSLYVGMTCLEDGKHVRTTVFEGGERRFITIRTANPKVAAELSAAIQEHTPLESARSPSAAARSPSAGAKETV